MKFNLSKLGLPIVVLMATVLIEALPAQAQSDKSLPIRGVVRPSQETTLSTDLFARISRLDVREGDRFKAGNLLVEFDCAGYRAERKAAVAEHLAQRLDYENKLVLEKHSAVGKHEIDVALALTQKAEAQIERLDARITQCSISAPFPGRVTELFVNQHEMPSAGSPIVKIINDTGLEIDLIIPSSWLDWLDQGTRFTFVVDETGRQYDCDVIRLAAAVDPVSQTIKIRAKFSNDPGDVLVGMSGLATFIPPEG